MNGLESHEGLNMSFNNFEDFLQMGGHGLYVWLCYGMGIFIYALAFIAPVLRKRAILKELRQIQRRKNPKQTQAIETHVN